MLYNLVRKYNPLLQYSKECDLIPQIHTLCTVYSISQVLPVHRGHKRNIPYRWNSFSLDTCKDISHESISWHGDCEYLREKFLGKVKFPNRENLHHRNTPSIQYQLEIISVMLWVVHDACNLQLISAYVKKSGHVGNGCNNHS